MERKVIRSWIGGKSEGLIEPARVIYVEDFNGSSNHPLTSEDWEESGIG